MGSHTRNWKLTGIPGPKGGCFLFLPKVGYVIVSWRVYFVLLVGGYRYMMIYACLKTYLVQAV